MTRDEAAANVGRLVVYRPPHNRPDGMPEEGVITSVNSTYVFVRYGSQQTPAATRPEDLRFVNVP